MTQIFFNLKGEFQWNSIVAIVAIIGAVTSFIFSVLGYINTKNSLLIQKKIEQKKIDADIISKSRIHWIDNARTITSQFITDSLLLGAHYKMFIEKIYQYNQLNLQERILIEADDVKKMKLNKELDDFNADMHKRVDTINNLLGNVSKNHLLIKLNFSNNFEHDQIIHLVTIMYKRLEEGSLHGWVQYYNQEILDAELDNFKKLFYENSRDAELLTNALRDYYKKEWRKVKRGE